MDFENLHQILRSLYDEMMPLCEDMAGVAKGIAGLGALFYVAYRVWQSLARAEPIDVFPMLRPFAIGLCIMFFPTVVLGTLSGVLSPIVQGTAKMLEAETLDMNEYREQKDKLEYEAMKRNPETAYLVSNEEFDKQLEELGWSPDDLVTMAGMYIERSMYQMKKSVRDFFRELLELLFQAAALVIDTLRTFFLVVLSILGPIAFAISVWDGFQSTLTQWICRYVQVYLWLPVSDMFSTILAKIQVLMLQSDIERMQADPNFSLDSSDGVYIVFMIIGIIGYFTIPTVSGWIIQAGGMGNYGRNVNQTAGKAGGLARSGADIIAIGGFRGGTGAAPTRIRDNVGIPIELALAAVDQRLRDEGIRSSVSLIAGGSIRSAADVVKAIALGADACYIATAALLAMGCHLCRSCQTGRCCWGIATQRPELVKRLDPEEAAARLVNLVTAWKHEIKEMMGGMGINSIEALRGNRVMLRGIHLNEKELEILGIAHAGE